MLASLLLIWSERGGTVLWVELDLLLNLSPLSGGARVRGDSAAGGAAGLPGGSAGRLWSHGDAGAAQEVRKPHHGLPVCAESQR